MPPRGQGSRLGRLLSRRCDARDRRAGDRNDSFSIDDSVPPVSYSGGAGTDTVSYGGATKLGSATVSLAGVANDGRGIAEDNIATDVESILGSFASDTLTAGTEAAAIDGSNGDDVIRGGPGDDRITSAYLSESGEDQGYVYRQGLDKVSCDGGGDFVLADRHDEIAADCEVVGRPKDALTFEFTGSRKADRITVTQLIEALVHAGGGADVVRLTGGGNGTIYGEGGADDLKGSSGFDRFYGGAGNDTIRARDRSRDGVSCGSGRDRVAKDCERVSRR